MTIHQRLTVQVHNIDADKPTQADEILAARLRALRAALNPLGDHARVLVINTDGPHNGLDDLLAGLYAPDEIDDNPERNPHPGYVPVENTDLRERLLAWRAAAVRAALADAERAHTLARFISHDAQQALIGHLDVDCALSRIRNRADTLLTLPLGQNGADQ